MARRQVSGPNAVGTGTHTIIIDEMGTGADTLRRRKPFTDAETERFTHHNRMFRAWPVRGSRDGTVNSKWSKR